jgi:hypothetical protein
VSVRVRDLLMRELETLRFEPTEKRIRGMFGEVTVVDSPRAMLVWVPKRVVPTYAVPAEDIAGDVDVARPREDSAHTAVGALIGAPTWHQRTCALLCWNRVAWSRRSQDILRMSRGSVNFGSPCRLQPRSGPRYAAPTLDPSHFWIDDGRSCTRCATHASRSNWRPTRGLIQNLIGVGEATPARNGAYPAGCEQERRVPVSR